MLALLVFLLTVLPCLGQQDGERILLVNRPTGPPKLSIDLTDYVSRDLSAIPGFAPVVFKPSLQSIKDLIAANTLSEADVKEPLSAESVRKVARALGIRRILKLSGQSTPEGVSAEAELEQLSGQQAWGALFSQKLEPYKGRGGKPSLIEGIKAQVAVIVERVTGAPARVQTQDPIAIRVEPKEPEKSARPPDSPPVGSQLSTTPPRSQSPAYELQADRYRREGDHANLIIALRKAVNDRPREPKLRRDLILAYLERGDHAAAREEAMRAVALAPEDGTLRRVLGEAYLKAGEVDSALRELREAIKSNPKDAAAHTALGDVYYASAKIEDAEKSYLIAAEMEPKNPLPHRRLARVYVDRAQFAAALKSLTALRAAVKEEEADSLLPDYAAILGVLESGLNEVLTRLHTNRQAVADGTRNREQAFTYGVAQRKRAEEIAAFLDAMPPIPSLAKVQGLYAQAAGFVGQAAEASLLFVENQDSKRDQEASLLRLEATRALSDASKRLKAATKS